MKQAQRPLERDQTPAEEIANSLSHALGLVAAIVATPFLIGHALALGDGSYTVGVSVFAATLMLLYLASTLYHALPSGAAKRAFRSIEHSAIYLLIAGTYTPFALGVFRGGWGWTLLSLIWGLAIVGIALKAFGRMRHPIASTGLYLLMGWLILIAVEPLGRLVPVAGIIWLAAGGIAYTVGVAFFATDSRLRYGHFCWHLMVMAGSACHFVAVYGYAA